MYSVFLIGLIFHIIQFIKNEIKIYKMEVILSFNNQIEYDR